MSPKNAHRSGEGITDGRVNTGSWRGEWSPDNEITIDGEERKSPTVSETDTSHATCQKLPPTGPLCVRLGMTTQLNLRTRGPKGVTTIVYLYLTDPPLEKNRLHCRSLKDPLDTHPTRRRCKSMRTDTPTGSSSNVHTVPGYSYRQDLIRF